MGVNDLNASDTALAQLQKQVRALALGQVVLTFDLYLYKAQIAQRRWGTPGGNDVALRHYQTIQELLAETAWPAELASQVADFGAHLSRFRQLLKAQDVTRVSSEATRLATAFAALREGLQSWAAGSP